MPYARGAGGAATGCTCGGARHGHARRGRPDRPGASLLAPVDRGPDVAVVVRTLAGAETKVGHEVVSLGGSVTAQLGIIDGFAATISRTALEALRSDPSVVSISPDAPLTPASANYDASGDVNSMASTADYAGAAAWWRNGYTGAGIDVALIDTGVSPVEGLDGSGKVVYGPDLSLESQAPNLTNLDSYGHGTFMAGLIAGHDDTLQAPYDQAPASAYRGMAPDSRIISIKVGTADGGTDVSQVIAAIDWVVQHAHDPGYNIRVINLSYGTNATQSYILDPLAYAAEVAWNSGIVVVAAGGNYGFQSHMNNAPALADPAIDPYVIAVGSTDPNGTPTMSDDTVAAFSPWPKRGATRGVDLVAPGSHLQGLRVPNSYIDVNHPEGQIDDRYLRGSGTSESAAIVSGAAALILQRYPNATPDRVKKLLTGDGLPDLWEGAGDRRWRAPDVEGAHDPPAVLRADVHPVDGRGLARARPRHRPPDRGRRGALGRAGRHGVALRRRRHGDLGGARQVVVGWGVEREVVVRGFLVRLVMGRHLLVRERMERQVLERLVLVRELVERQVVEHDRLVGQIVVGHLVER